MNIPEKILSLNNWRRTRYRFWREYLVDGEFELKKLRELVKANSISVDVGGNIGIYTYHLQRISEKVVVFEPNPYYAKFIEKLMLPRVQVVNAALSSSSGDIELHVPKLKNGKIDIGMATINLNVAKINKISHSIKTRMVRLDDCGYHNIGFMKIDVEGHEEEVIEGSLKTLSRDRPTLIIEIEERNNKGGVQRISDNLGKLGYSGYFYKDGKRCCIKDFCPLQHQKAQVEASGAYHKASPTPYINNFVFVPK